MAKKTLLYVPTARSLKLTTSWIKRTDFVDRLLVFHYHKDDADRIATKFFFKNNYDYLIMTTDDVIGTPDHVRLLLEDQRKHNFPVVSGWCNHKRGFASMSVKPVDCKNFWKLEPFTRYNFVTVRDVILAKYGYPFMKAWFIGMALTLIRKDILKKVPPRGFYRARDKLCKGKRKKIGREVMQDLAFSEDCAKKKIKITVDTRVFLPHIFGTKKYMELADWPRSKVKKRVNFLEATSRV